MPLPEDLALIEAAILRAGAIARDAFHANDSKVWDKAGNHPVTDADIAVNDYLLEVLMAARPDYRISCLFGSKRRNSFANMLRHICIPHIMLSTRNAYKCALASMQS